MHPRWILYFFAFISGGSIMVLELIASRILAPYAGSTIFTWTNIIGLILISLTLGYYFGGKFADKKPRPIYLTYLFLISALFVLSIVFWTDEFLFEFSNRINNIHIFSFISIGMLFSIPSILLAAVYPYIIKFALINLKQTGSITGKIYALSTIGSIIGTYLTGFLLIPYLGSRTILIYLSLILFICFLISTIKLEKKQFLVSFALILYIFLFLIYKILMSNQNKNSRVLIDTETQYSRVWIAEDPEKKTRQLATDIYAIQGSMDVNNPNILIDDYSQYFRLADYFSHSMNQSLMIGGGTYAYPKYFLKKYPNAFIDVVEIDPQITQLAYSHFYLPKDNRLSIFHEDGRVYLNNNQKKYNAIFIDALITFTPPFQLTTTEAIKQMKKALGEDGVILVNMISSLRGQNSKILEAQYVTYSEHFKHVYLFATNKSDPEAIQNVILVAHKSEDVLPLRNKTYGDAKLMKNNWKFENQFFLPPLTDDFAPTERYTENLVHR